MHLRRHSGHGVLGEDERVALVVCGSCGRLDSDVGRDAAQDDRLDAASAQLLFKVGSVERAPLPLGDLYIAPAEAGFGHQLRSIWRRWRGIWPVRGPVSRQAHDVADEHVDVNDYATCLTQCLGKEQPSVRLRPLPRAALLHAPQCPFADRLERVLFPVHSTQDSLTLSLRPGFLPGCSLKFLPLGLAQRNVGSLEVLFQVLQG